MHTAADRISGPYGDGKHNKYTRSPGSFPQHRARAAEGQRNHLDGASQLADSER